MLELRSTEYLCGRRCRQYMSMPQLHASSECRDAPSPSPILNDCITPIARRTGTGSPTGRIHTIALGTTTRIYADQGQVCCMR